jgi:hypothetical protein
MGKMNMSFVGKKETKRQQPTTKIAEIPENITKTELTTLVSMLSVHFKTQIASLQSLIDNLDKLSNAEKQDLKEDVTEILGGASDITATDIYDNATQVIEAVEIVEDGGDANISGGKVTNATNDQKITAESDAAVIVAGTTAAVGVSTAAAINNLD